jgi:hypothetical protein
MLIIVLFSNHLQLTRWSMKPKHANTFLRAGAALPGTSYYLDDKSRMLTSSQAQHSRPSHSHVREFSSTAEFLARADRHHGRVLLQIEQQMSLGTYVWGLGWQLLLFVCSSRWNVWRSQSEWMRSICWSRPWDIWLCVCMYVHMSTFKRCICIHRCVCILVF